jgi:hypothetical protein
MTEFNPIPTKKDDLITPSTKSVYKHHHKAAKFASPNQKKINLAINDTYHLLIELVKELYSTLPNESDRIIVQMNRAEEPLNPICMYTFLTPHFYFYLECSIVFQYRVEYQFENCPFEKEIMHRLKTTILRDYSTEIMKMPNYREFFAEVLKHQPERFKRIL